MFHRPRSQRYPAPPAPFRGHPPQPPIGAGRAGLRQLLRRERRPPRVNLPRLQPQPHRSGLFTHNRCPKATFTKVSVSRDGRPYQAFPSSLAPLASSSPPAPFRGHPDLPPRDARRAGLIGPRFPISRFSSFPIFSLRHPPSPCHPSPARAPFRRELAGPYHHQAGAPEWEAVHPRNPHHGV